MLFESDLKRFYDSWNASTNSYIQTGWWLRMKDRTIFRSYICVTWAGFLSQKSIFLEKYLSIWSFSIIWNMRQEKQDLCFQQKRTPCIGDRQARIEMFLRSANSCSAMPGQFLKEGETESFFQIVQVLHLFYLFTYLRVCVEEGDP